MIDLKAVVMQRIVLMAERPENRDVAREVMPDHSPEFRPYAEMGVERIAELMDQAYRAGDVRKWQMLEMFLLDRMDLDEKRISNLALGFAKRALESFDVRSPTALLAVSEAACEFAVALPALAASPAVG